MIDTLRRPPPLVAALGVALALHILLLFGIVLPETRRSAQTPLQVTLTTAPADRSQHSATLAAANQAGDDTVSRAARAAEALPLGERDALAKANVRNPGSADSTEVAVISRRPATTGQASNSGGERRRGAASDNPAQGQAKQRRARAASADARAAYLESWRREIEQVGSRYFPSRLLSNDGDNRLTLQVSLDAGGRITDMRLLNSSGNPELDKAAERILRTAAPFTPFPPALRKRQSQLTVAYDWQFVSSRDALITVTQP